MLPVILGGIALAAVGYGVKEYCESERCPWDERSYRDDEDEVSTNILDLINDDKKKIYTQLLPQLHTICPRMTL